MIAAFAANVRHAPQLWLADLDRAAEDAERDLDAAERARAAEYRLPADRDGFVRGRGFLRSILGSRLGVAPEDVRFTSGARGKPELAGQGRGLHFSFSRSRSLAVCATWDRPIGVDVEVLAPVPEWRTIAASVLSPDERAAVERSADPAGLAFLGAWTRHEALVKAAGVGLVGGSIRDVHAAGAGTWVGACAGKTFEIRTTLVADAAAVISIAAEDEFRMPPIGRELL